MILFADDDEDDRVLSMELLQEDGLTNEIKFVSNGIELIEHLKASPQQPGLIIVDYQMPKMNGIEALHQMKKENLAVNIPVIFAKSSLNLPEFEILNQWNNLAFIEKPIDSEKLNHALNSIPNQSFQLDFM